MVREPASRAKGQVERAHLIFQDRSVKGPRLRGLSTPEADNTYLAELRAGYNQRFISLKLTLRQKERIRARRVMICSTLPAKLPTAAIRPA